MINFRNFLRCALCPAVALWRRRLQQVRPHVSPPGKPAPGISAALMPALSALWLSAPSSKNLACPLDQNGTSTCSKSKSHVFRPWCLPSFLPPLNRFSGSQRPQHPPPALCPPPPPAKQVSLQASSRSFSLGALNAFAPLPSFVSPPPTPPVRRFLFLSSAAISSKKRGQSATPELR